jgi:CRISPR system Cascade subunit CasA
MNFNLTSDPWIPVRWLDGRSTSVSLHELFVDASKIADLAVPPHERISILRLLVCIAQAAHGAPETSDDWGGWDDGLESSVAGYLAKWRDHFHLMGEGSRFLQIPIKETQQKPLLEFLEFKMRSNDTLFDHEGGMQRFYRDASIALNLLTFQNFFLPGATGSPLIGGIKGSGPAINFLHAFLIGGNLKKTLVLNCLDENTIQANFPIEGMGRPVWEADQTEIAFSQIDKIVAGCYLGRLVPMPALVWLGDDSCNFFVKQGVKYFQYKEDGSREPSSTLVTASSKSAQDKTNVYLLKGDPSRAIWRDLHSVAVIRNSGAESGEQCGPLIFRSHLDDPIFENGECGIWCGELVRAKDSKGMPTAKLETFIESQFPAPKELFTMEGQKRYEAGVKFANKLESLVVQAIKNYIDKLRPKPKRPAKNEAMDYSSVPAAKRHFWNTLDQQSEILLSLLKNLGTTDDPMGSANFGEARDPWTTAVRAAADAAYEHTCPRGNPRQYEAYAAGLRVLRPLPKKPKPTTRKPNPATSNS